MHRLTALISAVALANGLAACGGDDPPPPSPPPDPAEERTDRPAEPPRGWTTLVNRTVGFSISVPPGWSARKRMTATLLRSDDRRLALTVAADRSRDGRDLAAAEYARRTLEALPGFTGLSADRLGSVRGSPYRTALVDGSGSVENGERRRVTVAVFQRPGRVTYAAVAFRDPRLSAARERRLTRVLASLRARRPAG